MGDTRAFTALAGARYTSLTTFRRTGEPVATPVWFAEHTGVIYVHADGGKVKRIRNDPRVSLARCTFGGRVTGPAVEGRAHVVADPAEMAVAEAALNRKYWVVRPLYYGALNALRVVRRRPPGARSVHLAITPAP
jgi:PPOX class probable F420-dependent enzyme